MSYVYVIVLFVSIHKKINWMSVCSIDLILNIKHAFMLDNVVVMLWPAQKMSIHTLHVK